VVSDTLSAIVSTQRRGRSYPALYVGLAGDAPRTPAARIGLRGVDRVELRRGTTRRVERTRVDGADVTILELADPRMSSQHARLSRVGTAWVLEDQNAKNGTWVGAKRVTRHPLEDGEVILVGHTAVVFRDHGGEADDLDPATGGTVPGLDTLSVPLANRFAELAKAARDRVPVEIHGESGTGKELIARAVHALSSRGGKFVAINCGSLTGTLLEGELFGHRKGAYTGAAEDRAGLVRTADGGTLFLDEVAELPASSQTALLRVLQEGEVTPLGGDKAVKVDVRLVTATHRDLDADVAANRFRADLRARMLGVTITLPALRERREDLGLLIAALLDRLAPGRPTAFSADAVAAIYAYGWPLNVRELERCLAAALAVSGERIELEHLPAHVRSPRATSDAPAADDDALREQLTASIARHDGNLAAVAREFGKDRTQIRRWMKRFGLSRTDDSDSDG
jgi:DNA-binding NtrC family response regulator